MNLKGSLIDCHNQIREYINRTPVMSSSTFNNRYNCELYFKCENFQKMGAFKMRGACNAMVQLSEEGRNKGVVTHSSGNMAQAVALAAKTMDIHAYIVMPENAPQVKKNAVIGYGAEVIICESNIYAREKGADKVQEETGASFIHPSNDLNVILGQGTVAKELLEDHPDLDILIAPVGGGGLLAGTALAAEFFGNNCTVYGAEPLNADDAKRSLDIGTIQQNDKSRHTIADGLRTELGDINFPIIKNHVKDILTVEEEEIIASMRLILERMKILVEPSSAVVLAAIEKYNSLFEGKKIGLIISGGNVDLSQLPFNTN